MRNLFFALGIVIVIVVAFAFVSCGRGSRNSGLTASLGSTLSGGSGSDGGAGAQGNEWENPPVQRSIDEVIAEVRAYEPPLEVASSSGFDAQVFEMLRDELVRALEARRDRGVSMLPSREGITNPDKRKTSAAGDSASGVVNDIFVQPQPNGANDIRLSSIVTGDFDGNGEVGVADITPIAMNYLASYGDGADVNGDTDFVGDKLDRALVIAANGGALVDDDTNVEIGVPYITTIAENYLSQGPAGYDVWRVPIEGGASVRLPNAFDIDAPSILRADGGDTGTAARSLSVTEYPPDRAPATVQNPLSYFVQRPIDSVQRPVLGAPWIEPMIGLGTGSDGRSLARYISQTGDEGVEWSNGDYYYMIEPRDEGEETPPPSPDSAGFNVLVTYESAFKVTVGAEVNVLIRVYGDVAPISYGVNWGDGSTDAMASSTLEYRNSHRYTKSGNYAPFVTVQTAGAMVIEDAPVVCVTSAVPFTPTGLTVSPLGNGVNLNWDIVDPAQGIESYNVYWSLRRGCSRPELLNIDPDTGERLPVMGNTYETDIVTELAQGKAIYFKVTAVKDGLESPFGNEFKWPITDITPPNISKSSESDAHITLTWSEVPGQAGYEVTGYRVYKGYNSGGPYPVRVNTPDPLTTNVFTYNTLSSENELYFVAVTVTNVGDSGFSNEVSWFRSTPAPPAPTITSADAGNNRVTVHWTPGADDGYGSADGFNVYYYTSDNPSNSIEVASMPAGATEATVLHDAGSHPVENGTQYYFWVTATRGGKESAFSSAWSSIPFNVAPTASFTTAPALPVAGNPGTQVTFTSTSTDSDGAIANYAWDFDGDGTAEPGYTAAIVQYTYTEEGTFTPRLTVTDDDDATDTAPDAPTSDDRVTIGVGSPTANANANPMTGSAPLYVDFDATGSNDPDGTIDVYEWQFFSGDGWHDYTATSGVANDVPYNTPGSSIATLRVTDDDGKTATDFVTIVVNAPPVANGNGNPTSGNAPLLVDFNASGSYDSDGSIVKWEWKYYATDTWHDCTPQTGAGSYTYNSGGSYTATLRVTDDDGGTGTDTVNITVNSPPVAKANANPTDGNQPLEVNFNASGTGDPDGTITKYEWDFDGDGFYDWESPTSGTPPPYTYDDDGTYDAVLRVTDNYIPAATDTDTVQITVTNTPPTADAQASPTSGTKPLTVYFNDGNSYDPDGTIVKWEWDWTDDGAYDWWSTVNGDAQYTYIDHGDFTAKLRVTDDDDVASTDTVGIHVNAAPVADLQASPTEGDAPLMVNFDASQSYDPIGTIVKHEWDWTNDGTWELDSGTEATASHEYTIPGTFTATVRVTDNEGLSDSASITCVVTDPAAIWLHSWGGVLEDRITNVDLDGDGNIYVAGGTSSFGAGNTDILVLKYSSDGILQWSKTWGGVNYDNAGDFTVSSNGDLYVTGETESYGAGNKDVLLLKYDSEGTLLWQRTWGGSGHDRGYGIALDSDENIFITGIELNYGAGWWDVFLLKYDSSGSILWQKAWGGTDYEYGSSIAFDSFGNIYVSGGTASYGHQGGYDALLLKYNSSGVLQWQKIWGGTGSDQGGNIVLDSESSIYFSVGQNSYGAGQNDMALLKLNSSGTLVWSKAWGGQYDDGGSAAWIDLSGNLWILGGTTSFGSGASDAFMLKCNPDGTMISQNIWGTASNESGSALIMNDVEDIIYCGFAPNINSYWHSTSGTWQNVNTTVENASGTAQNISGVTGSPNGQESWPAGTEDIGGGGDDVLIMKLDKSKF